MNKNFWDEFDKSFTDLLFMLEKRKALDINFQMENRTCLSTAANLFFILPALVLSGKSEKANECADIGLQYVKIARETGDRRDISKILAADHAAYSLGYMEYYFSWYLSGIENTDLLLFSLDKIQKVVDVYKLNRKMKEYQNALYQVIVIAIKSMQLDVAKKFVEVMLGHRPNEQAGTKYYSQKSILSAIVDSLCQHNENSKTMCEIYNQFFYELKNGNFEFINGFTTINDIVEISIIYHKYFSNNKYDQPLCPEAVIKSVRYGIEKCTEPCDGPGY